MFCFCSVGSIQQRVFQHASGLVCSCTSLFFVLCLFVCVCTLYHSKGSLIFLCSNTIIRAGAIKAVCYFCLVDFSGFQKCEPTLIEPSQKQSWLLHTKKKLKFSCRTKFKSHTMINSFFFVMCLWFYVSFPSLFRIRRGCNRGYLVIGNYAVRSNKCVISDIQ